MTHSRHRRVGLTGLVPPDSPQDGSGTDQIAHPYPGRVSIATPSTLALRELLDAHRDVLGRDVDVLAPEVMKERVSASAIRDAVPL